MDTIWTNVEWILGIVGWICMIYIFMRVGGGRDHSGGAQGED